MSKINRIKFDPQRAIVIETDAHASSCGPSRSCRIFNGSLTQFCSYDTSACLAFNPDAITMEDAMKQHETLIRIALENINANIKI